MKRFKPVLMVLVLLLVAVLLFTQNQQNKLLRTQVTQLQGDAKIEQAKSEYLEAKMDYLTHPATVGQRSVDWILQQGEFAK